VLNIIVDKLRMQGYSVEMIEYGRNWIMLRIDGSAIRVVWIEETGEVFITGDTLPADVKKSIESVFLGIIRSK